MNARIARALADIAGQQPNVRLTQSDLAAAADTSRETVNRCMLVWKRLGVVSVSMGRNARVTVHDLDALEALATTNGAPKDAALPVNPNRRHHNNKRSNSA